MANTAIVGGRAQGTFKIVAGVAITMARAKLRAANAVEE